MNATPRLYAPFFHAPLFHAHLLVPSLLHAPLPRPGRPYGAWHHGVHGPDVLPDGGVLRHGGHDVGRGLVGLWNLHPYPGSIVHRPCGRCSSGRSLELECREGRRTLPSAALQRTAAWPAALLPAATPSATLLRTAAPSAAVQPATTVAGGPPTVILAHLGGKVKFYI